MGQSDQIKFYHASTLNTILGDQRTIDYLMNMFGFQSKSEIAVSDILSSIVSRLSESETESKKKKKISRN